MNANGKPAPTLLMGEMIPYTKNPVLGTKRGNKLIALANGWLKSRIIRGAPQDGIYITPQGIIFALSDSGGSGTGAGSVISMYKITAIFGDYVIARTWDGTGLGTTDIFIAKPTPLRTSFTSDGTSTYVYSGSNVRTKTTAGVDTIQNLTPTYDVGEIIFAGTSANGTAVVNAPSLIEVLPSRVWITDQESDSVRYFKVKEIFSDVYRCRIWDGTSEGGSDVYVGKSAKLRNSISSEVLDVGLAVSYVYDASFVLRVATASPSGEVETQDIIPRILVNDVIAAGAVNPALTLSKSPSDGTFVSVSWIDLNYDGRAWCSVPADEL